MKSIKRTSAAKFQIFFEITELKKFRLVFLNCQNLILKLATSTLYFLALHSCAVPQKLYLILELLNVWFECIDDVKIVKYWSKNVSFIQNMGRRCKKPLGLNGFESLSETPQKCPVIWLLWPWTSAETCWNPNLFRRHDIFRQTFDNLYIFLQFER